MCTQTVTLEVPSSANLVHIRSASVEETIQQRLAAERARLEREAGLGRHDHHQFKRPRERPFTKSERGHTALLFGGLTWKHEKLVQGALEGLGYLARPVPTPNVRAFQTGKEYGNSGQCNATYFTVGNLVQYLQSLEAEGLTKQEIIDRHVFFTAGACGPCRFGMYEAEYRLALRNSGFDGFRVLLFQQSGGLSQSDTEAGLEMNLDFFLGILNALNCGDVIKVAEEIVEHSGTPYFRFKDIDENKPSGSIRIRVETIGYFLKRYREDMVRNKQKTGAIEDQLREKLDSMAGAFEAGSMPRIHVSVAALAASRSAEPEYETVSGD
jgi:hypothetical protein